MALMSSAPCRPLGFLREKQRTLSQDLLQDLLVWLVQNLHQEIPGLGETVAFDVTHIYGWVRENNPRVYVQGTFDVTHIPQRRSRLSPWRQEEQQPGATRWDEDRQKGKSVRLWLGHRHLHRSGLR